MIGTRGIAKINRRLRRAEKRLDALSNRLSRFTRTKKAPRRRKGDKAALYRDHAVMAFIDRHLADHSAANLRRMVREIYGDGRTPSRAAVSAYLRGRREVINNEE